MPAVKPARVSVPEALVVAVTVWLTLFFVYVTETVVPAGRPESTMDPLVPPQVVGLVPVALLITGEGLTAMVVVAEVDWQPLMEATTL